MSDIKQIERKRKFESQLIQNQTSNLRKKKIQKPQSIKQLIN